MQKAIFRKLTGMVFRCAPRFKDSQFNSRSSCTSVKQCLIVLQSSAQWIFCRRDIGGLSKMLSMSFSKS